MLLAHGHDPSNDAAIAAFFVYAGIHIGLVIWAVTNRHSWGAIGIFLFPVVGDLAYVIYYFATREPSRGIEAWTPPSTGDTVTATAVLYDRRGRLAMRPGEEGTVVRVEQGGKFVTVKSSNGKLFEDLRPNGRLQVMKVLESHSQTEPDRESRPAPPPDSARAALRSQLEELSRLHEDGLINEEELSAKRRQLLGLDQRG